MHKVVLLEELSHLDTQSTALAHIELLQVFNDSLRAFDPRLVLIRWRRLLPIWSFKSRQGNPLFATRIFVGHG